MADQDTSDPARLAAGTWLLYSIILTIPAIVLAVFSAGAGHGDYLFARALFPVPMLLSFNVSISVLSLVAALLQFPVYSWIVGGAKARERAVPILVVVALHLAAVIACFSGILPNFS